MVVRLGILTILTVGVALLGGEPMPWFTPFAHAQQTQAEGSPEDRQQPAEAESEPPAVGSYVFESEGKHDPFRPFIEALARTQQPRPEIPLTPLQKYNISQLKLVGIIKGAKESKALIQDPSNKGYIVTTGTLIGPNWGRVTEIYPTHIVIEEELKDPLGRSKKQKITVKLQSPATEEK